MNVLMVEDDPASAIILGATLEDEQHDVKRAICGTAAWALFQESSAQFDVIITDWMMPDMDGLELCRLVRGWQLEDGPDTRPYVYIIMLTARGERQDRLSALEAGVDDFLIKPLDPDELAARLVSAGRVLDMQRELRNGSARLARLHCQLERRNLELAHSIGQVEAANEELEQRVRERTWELEQSNFALQAEVRERMGAEERIRRQYERLETLRSIDAAIGASMDLRFTLSFFLGRATKLLGSDAAAILLCNPHTSELEVAARIGLQPRSPSCAQCCIEEAADTRRPSMRDCTEDKRCPPLMGVCDHPDRTEEDEAYVALPLIAQGQLKGVWQLQLESSSSFDADWQETAESLAGQAALAIANASLFEDLQRSHRELMLAYDATIVGWSRALDLRDKETEGHTQRVTEMCLRLARRMQIPESEIVHIRRGALLHDIGKMGVPDSILLKPDSLTDDEWAVMRQHPHYAEEMLSPISFLGRALEIPLCHHEKWDGSGYPRGLRGDEIPLAARLFAIVDVWDALSSDRPYRAKWAPATVLAHLRSLSGTHFDPSVVNEFIGLVATSDDAQELEYARAVETGVLPPDGSVTENLQRSPMVSDPVLLPPRDSHCGPAWIARGDGEGDGGGTGFREAA